MKNNYESLEFSDASYPFILRKRCYEDFPPHWHDSIEIHSIYTGTNEAVIGSNQYPTEPGDIVCIPSSHMHWYAKKLRSRYHTLIIHPRFLKKCGISPSDRLIPRFKDEYVTKIFEEIVQESDEAKPYHEAAIKAKIITLWIYLYRSYATDSIENTQIDTRTETVIKVLDYIKEHYAEEITLPQIGRIVGISVNYLCHCFREETQTTIKKYINFLRCNEAKNLLLDGNCSVTEVGLRCGYNNMSYFSKTYCNIMGELPSETLDRANRDPKNQKIDSQKS